MSTPTSPNRHPDHTPAPRRVLIAGGYGYFGAMIAAALATEPAVRLIIAGRNPDRARRAAKLLNLDMHLGHGALDVYLPAEDLTRQLARLRADMVVDATGAWSTSNHALARASIATGASYIDIADSRPHVCGIQPLDAAARARRVLVASGTSSVPTLSAAVIDAHLSEFAELHHLTYGISASELTPGAAAVTSVLEYCGKPIPGYANGRPVSRFGWQGGRPVRFHAPMGWRWLARCDIPDLELFPARYPTLRSIEFRAGVAPLPSMSGMWLLSWLVRLGVLDSAAPLAPRLQRWARWLQPFGAGRSGMYVDMRGIDRNGQHARRRWQLVAEDNHGPRVAAMGAVALARRIARQGLPMIGAMPAVGLLTLDEYLAELTGLNIEISTERL